MLTVEPLLTTQDVAAWLNVRPSTVRNWAGWRLIPSFQLGKVCRFSKSEIEARLDQLQAALDLPVVDPVQDAEARSKRFVERLMRYRRGKL